jgi:hypothetical protein
MYWSTLHSVRGLPARGHGGMQKEALQQFGQSRLRMPVPALAQGGSHRPGELQSGHRLLHLPARGHGGLQRARPSHCAQKEAFMFLPARGHGG